MRDRKPLHVRVGLAFVVAENLGGIIARAHAGTADVESHLRGMKKVVEQRVPGRRLQPVKRVASRVGESRTEAEHLLIFSSRIQFNDVSARRAAFPRHRGLGMIAQLPAGHADRNILRCWRCRDRQRSRQLDCAGCRDSVCGKLQEFSSALFTRHVSSPGNKSNQ